MSMSLALLCNAQNSLTGTIVDSKSKSALEMVAVQLFAYHNGDSTMITGAQTNQVGIFKLENVRAGKYNLIISSLGYKTKSVSVEMKNADIDLGKISFTEDAVMLDEVQVKGKAVEMVVKGDTLEYNAGAFKTTDNAMVEELLNKMPGVEVSKDGSVTVNGEKVTAVRVDGKKFFGDDVQSATKNIPANMIDKVQVIDQQSEMAKLTGFEDDDTERIINLTLKQDKKKGAFGNFTGALGADMVADNNKWFGYHQDPRSAQQDAKAFFDNEFRYNAGAFVNMLYDNTQYTIIGSANNTNEMRMGRGRGSISPQSGITWSENIGVNISSEPNDDLELGGNAAFAHTDNKTSTVSNQETYADTVTYINNDSTVSEARNYDVSLRFEVEWEIDSLNKLILKPTMAYTNQAQISGDVYSYQTLQNDVLVPTTQGSQATEAKSAQIQGGLQTTYSHSFDSKKGRKLTLRANVSMNNTTGSETDIYTKYSYGLLTDNVNQIIDRKNTNLSYSLRTSYVEPLYANRHFLETVLEFSGSNRQSDKVQHSLDTQTGTYSNLDSAYSSNFSNAFFSEALEVNYLYKEEKYSLTVGLKVNPSQTLVEQRYASGFVFDTLLSVWNYSPAVTFKYKFGKKQFARIQYRGKSSQPSITQMQPSADNSNSMSVRVGNLNLNPAFEHSLRLMFSKYNQDRMSSITGGIRASLTKDALVNNSIYDITGKVYRQTVNAQSLPWSVGGDMMYSQPFAKNWLTFNSRTSLSYSNQIAYVSQGIIPTDIDVNHMRIGDLSQTGNLRLQEDMSFRLAHDIADAGLKLTGSYSRTQNSLSTAKPTNVFNWSTTVDVIFHLPKQWNISTDFGYTGRYGYNLSDIDELLWNVSIDKTVLNGAGVVSLKAYDLLNQKKNIVETVGENYVKYAKYNTLPTYFLISFTYKLNKMGDLKAKGPSKNMQREFEENGGPMGPPPSGGATPQGNMPIGAPPMM